MRGGNKETGLSPYRIEMASQVFVLPLSDLGEPQPGPGGDFINLPIPYESYKLRFVIFSTSSVTNESSLWCNVPQDPSAPFERNKFYEYPIRSQFNKDTYVDVDIHTPGTYSFYITYMPISQNYFERYEEKHANGFNDDMMASQNPVERSLFKETYIAMDVKGHLASTRKFYFSVSAGFTLNNNPLPLNALSIQTVISKWMGEYSTWDKKLAQIKSKGYNMIHFTPLQERGDSDSPYSIFDQLKWDPKCFKNGEDDVKDLVETMEKKHCLLSMTDIVLNHTANNSEWLKYHPDAGYSVYTAPHLRPALELDDELAAYSGRLKELGLPIVLETEDDVDKVILGINKNVLQKIRLWEFYVVDVKNTLKRVREIVENDERFNAIYPTRVPPNLEDDMTDLAKYVVAEAGSGFYEFGPRFIKAIDADYFVSILKALFPDPNVDPSIIVEKATDILNEINSPLYKDYDFDKAEIISNLRGRLKYLRLEDGGPNLGEITTDRPIHEPYFTKVKTEPNGEIVSLVNNGFIWNGDPMIDFASSDSKAYLRREVISWGDCVKLRYGSKPEDSPFLWEHMTTYTQKMAKYFHGFRLDNCHSTPIHVAEYLLDKARLIRSNLYVAAELFTGSESKDRVFVRRLGITSLIREAMQAWSPGELSRLVHKHGGRPIGSFSKQPLVKHAQLQENPQNVHFIRTTPIHALFMDCTHDNEMPYQKRTVEDTISTAALVSMCACAVGSTMGYDECYPHHLNVVHEKRPYTFGSGISEVKSTLLGIHEDMGCKNAEEMFVHHEGQYITVHRVNPKEGTGWFLIARTKFSEDDDQKSKFASGTPIFFSQLKASGLCLKYGEADTGGFGFLPPRNQLR
jgi:glycogen debranching enzyme